MSLSFIPKSPDPGNKTQGAKPFKHRPLPYYRFTRRSSVLVDDGALVERTGDHVELLLLGELDEVHRVAGDTHGQVRVLLRVLDGILELLLAQHVDVGVVQAVAVAGVKDAYEVADTFVLVAAQTIRGDGVGQRDAVKSILPTENMDGSMPWESMPFSGLAPGAYGVPFL